MNRGFLLYYTQAVLFASTYGGISCDLHDIAHTSQLVMHLLIRTIGYCSCEHALIPDDPVPSCSVPSSIFFHGSFCTLKN